MMSQLKTVLWMAGLAALALAGCSKSGASPANDDKAAALATRSQELVTKMPSQKGPASNLVVKGELPDWKFDGYSKLKLEEKVGKMTMVVMDLELGSWGGSKKGEADFKKQIEAERDALVGKVFAGQPIKLEQDIKELKPRVWSFVTKAKDFAEGSLYEVFVYHFDPKLPLMHRCKGQARVTRAALWPEVLRVCAGLSIEVHADNPMRAFYQ
jgi:hypothetical protein